MKCPACQTESSGAYCPECGTPLRVRCRACGAAQTRAARFCTACGARTRRSRANLPWYVAGAAVLGLIVLILVPAPRAAPAAEATPVQAPMLDGGDASSAPAAGETPPPLTGTPREQADRLFNLIMESKEKGDTARAKYFVPMGVQVYAMAGELDADGLYHLSLLQTLAGNGKDALATAEKILARSPANLLGLAAAAEAAMMAGDRSAARRYYQHYLDSFAAEQGKKLPEYNDHAAVLAQYQAEAQRFVRQ